MRCKPICWKHFLYFHKILYIYCLPILYNKGKPLPIMLNDSYLSNIIRTWNCSKFWLFFITKVSFISLVLSDVKKFRIGFISSVINFPYCNYSKKYIIFFSNLQCRICSLLNYIVITFFPNLTREVQGGGREGTLQVLPKGMENYLYSCETGTKQLTKLCPLGKRGLMLSLTITASCIYS